MNRSRISTLNAVSALLLTLSSGLLALVMTRLLLLRFGSDFNGLSSTATQLVNLLLVLEGGYTLAINVALFTPYLNRDNGEIASIYSATRTTFRRIGLVFFIVGIGASVAYSFTVNTSLDRVLVIYVLVMTVIPNAVNLFFTTKYRVLIQAEQKEYVISFITFLTTVTGYAVNILLLYLGLSKMWYVRTIISALSIANSIIICIYARRKYRQILVIDAVPGLEKIKGTRDVFAQKITSVIYSTFPIVFISISKQGGTTLASVYAVYMSVFSLVKNLLYSIMNAPRLAMGQVIAGDNQNKARSVFAKYELVSVFILVLAWVTTACLIMPFVRIYAGDIKDSNYTDPVIAALLLVTMLFEVLHIPCGHVINMSGNFKTSKYYQIAACIALIVCAIAGANLFGLYGIIVSVTITSILLFVLEVRFVHCIYYRKMLGTFVRIVASNLLVGLVLFSIEYSFFQSVDTIVGFAIAAVLSLLVNSGVLICCNFLFNNILTKEVWYSIKCMLR